MIHIGQYIAGASFTHRLDPRVKMISAIVLSILIFRAVWFDVYLISLFLLTIMAISRLKAGAILRAIKPMAFFAGLLFLLHLFFTDGTALLALPRLHLKITHEGLFRGAFVAWQFFALVLSGAILTMTTPPSEMVSGLEKLLRPFKYLGIPTQDIAVMVSMALRFVPTLLEEFDRIRMAQTARGADVRTGPLAQRVKTAAAMTLPLMMSALRRAEDLAEAMESRGYHRGPRTTLRALKIGGQDYAALSGLALFIALLAIFRVYVN
ncbi:MAG: energy-coupling factor transporter transmembrane protein EcfT [Syntrophus sp. (in: bacteria)]|nr:energy-coupling factor transporter transmembrane protein EcfT [Syntrophus sp. (in: bacteria)]